MVVGVIGQGTSRTLTASWDAPLEQSNAGNQSGLEKISSFLQAGTSATSITTFSTTQIWGGNKPLTFNVVLNLFAWDDAYGQVMQPLQWLEEFASPDVKGYSAFEPNFISNIIGSSTNDGNKTGRIPKRIILNLGRRMIVPECIIESVSAPIDGEKDSYGNLIRSQVTLGIQTLTMLNGDAIGATYAQSSSAGLDKFLKFESSSWDKKTKE